MLTSTTHKRFTYLISEVNSLKCTKYDYFFILIGFYVTLAQYRSYRDVSALLVEEDLRCLSVHYSRHKRAPESMIEKKYNCIIYHINHGAGV
jgi:hypothetical protein